MNKKLLFSTLLFTLLANMCFEAQAMRRTSQLLLNQARKASLFAPSTSNLIKKRKEYDNLEELLKDFAQLDINDTKELCYDHTFSIKNQPYFLTKKEIPERNEKIKYLKFVYNDPNLFDEKAWITFNAAFKLTGKDAFTKETWNNNFGFISEAFKDKIGAYYFHAITDENDTIIAYRFGGLNDEHPYPNYTATLPAFAHNDLAWLLMLSIFDRYPNIKTIKAETISESGTNFCLKHGFTKTGEKEQFNKLHSPESTYLTLFELTREKAEKIVQEKETRKKENLGEI